MKTPFSKREKNSASEMNKTFFLKIIECNKVVAKN